MLVKSISLPSFSIDVLDECIYFMIIMEHLEGSGTPVLSVGRTVLKG